MATRDAVEGDAQASCNESPVDLTLTIGEGLKVAAGSEARTFEQCLRDMHDIGKTSVASHVGGGVTLSVTAEDTPSAMLRVVGNAVEQIDS